MSAAVAIGSRWTPHESIVRMGDTFEHVNPGREFALGRDAERLQRALLQQPPVRRRNFWKGKR